MIEPQDATWVEDADSRASATVSKSWNDGTETAFREFVTVLQNDVNFRYSGDCPGVAAVMQCAVPNVAAEGGGVPETEPEGPATSSWDEAVPVEDVEPCPTCGSLELWQTMRSS